MPSGRWTKGSAGELRELQYEAQVKATRLYHEALAKYHQPPLQITEMKMANAKRIYNKGEIK